ncbi:hypothetical protein NH286_03055 [Anaerococcus sp. NML200574]|uniref:hypothetical protein n=1 Tax=Anaerococcus sp. NML200574 TaxID=2954486 RepID=UPI002236F41E|nr:hypothetical protein [Anaerococcus sp. NML200574]MCW6678131.1 hypothetical protein [Anaerococcus sp. NML200574]
MKKAFISIYVLIILLLLALSVSFIAGQNQVDTELSNEINDKKQSLFDAESFANVLIEELSLDKNLEPNSLKGVLYLRSDIEIYQSEDENNLQFNLKSKYKNTISRALIKYKFDENDKFILINKRIY